MTMPLALSLTVFLALAQVRSMGAILPIAGGPFEASAVAHVPGVHGVLFADDGRTEELFWMELDEKGQQRGSVVPIPLGTTITDMEGMTFDGEFHYVVGSQSKTSGFDGDGLVRFRFDPVRRRVTNVEPVSALKAWLAANVAELRGTANRIGDKVLNIEAIAWDPDNRRLLLGLRAPVIDGYALVIPLRLKNEGAPLSASNLTLAGETIRLPLGGDGVRSLEYVDESKRFWLIAANSLNAETRDFRVMEWNGQQETPGLRQLATFPRRLKPEGIAPPHAGRGRSVVVFDTSRFTLFQASGD